MRSVETAPGSTSTLRTANQQRVLDVLRGRPEVAPDVSQPLTQADLSRITGLAPATVSNIVRDLSAAGLVDTDPGRGRRGTLVRLSRAAGLVAGVDVGHSHVAVAIGDLTGAILGHQRRRIGAGHGWQGCLSIADDMLTALLQEADSTVSEIRRMVLGLPTPILDGVARSSAILPGWAGVNARQVSQEWFGLTVDVENDANLGALAEHRRGAAAGQDTVVYLKISSGVGAGIIINNQLFHGTQGTAGEIGHLTLDEEGPLCRCGSRGCLEAYASIGTVQALLAGQLPDATLDDIVLAARNGHVAAIRALEDAGLRLGWGLASVVNLINPSGVVIGGDMSRAGDLLLEPTRVGLRRNALDAVAATPIDVGRLGELASLTGAVVLAAEATELVAG